MVGEWNYGNIHPVHLFSSSRFHFCLALYSIKLNWYSVYCLNMCIWEFARRVLYTHHFNAQIHLNFVATSINKLCVWLPTAHQCFSCGYVVSETYRSSTSAQFALMLSLLAVSTKLYCISGFCEVLSYANYIRHCRLADFIVQTLVSCHKFNMGTDKGSQILHSQILLLYRKINALQSASQILPTMWYVPRQLASYIIYRFDYVWDYFEHQK